MNIVVIGAGGIGGYFGGRIANAGYKVTFIARGKHLEAIKSKGLQVKSTKGDFIVHPNATDNINDIKNPDLIILGVKSWQVEEVAKHIKPIVTDSTMVLPLQNGADNVDKLLSHLNEKNVLAGLCKIVSKVEAPGIINHFAFEPEVIFGENDNSITVRIKKVKTVFDKAGFKNKIAEDIHKSIWRKFLFITMVSGIASLTRVVFGEMLKDKNIEKIILDTANEIKHVAIAKGINISEDDVDFAMNMYHNSEYDTTASMQRDIMEGKPSELENFNGYIVKQGKLLGIPTPTNSFIYEGLLPQERLARKLK